MQQARCSLVVSASVCLALWCLAVPLSATSALGAERVIGAASSMATIFPDDPPAAGDLAREITLSAARGEPQSAQVVMVAGDQPLSVQRVEVSGLRSGAARIGKGNIEVRLVAYVEIKQGENSFRGTRRPGLWPDPLLAFRPFTCPAGEDRLLWVTVKVPRTATPGRYEGSIKLYSSNSLEASLPIRLTVWRFTLPEMPSLATSYWSNTEACYDFSVEPEAFIRTIRLFGEYRVSTDLWPSWRFYNDPRNMRKWVVLWYVESDGRITCDISGLQRTIEAAIKGGGFGTLQIGHGCATGSEFADMPLIDRRTGRLLPVGSKERDSALSRVRERLKPQELDGFPGTYFARLFLPQMCDWLQSKGLLDRSYLQLVDEVPDPAQWPSIIQLYQRYRVIEPRLKLLSDIGIHPELQGAFDIWSPYTSLYESETYYDMVRKGISLYGPKNFKATVTASSSPTSTQSASRYFCRPIDAYDGCDYTKWAPEADPTADTPQRIRFDFNDPSGGIDGLRMVPFPYPVGSAPTDTVWVVEGSLDGQNFSPLELTKRPGIKNAYSFPLHTYKAVRVTHAVLGSRYAPAAPQDIPTLNQASTNRRPDGSLYIAAAEGIREVEFLREGVPLEAARAQGQVRPAEMWEYSVGASYPSVCVDADASEIRAIGWQCWARGLVGYLNYGGAQWTIGGAGIQERPKSEDTLIWTVPDIGGRGSPWIVYPGQKEVLPSVRLARFRDGVDDYDYLSMLAKKQPDHPVLQQLRNPDSAPYYNVGSMLAARQAVGEALDKLYASPGMRPAALQLARKPFRLLSAPASTAGPAEGERVQIRQRLYLCR